MIENSFIFSCLAFIIEKLKAFYQKSFCRVIVNKISAIMFSFWDGSFLRSILFTEAGGDNFLRNSIAGKSVAKLQMLLKRISSFPYESSLIVSSVKSFGDGFLFFSLRCFGLFICPYAVLSFFYRGYSNFNWIICTCLLVFGIICCFINISLSVLLRSSFLAKIACTFFAFNITSLPNKTLNNKKHYYVSLFLGAAFGAVSIFTGPVLSLLAAFAVTGALLTLYKIEVGIFASAFLLPLLPTKYIAGLSVLSVISYFIKVIFGGKETEFKLSDFFILIYALLLIYSLFISYIPSNSLFMVFCYVLFIMFYFTVRNTIKTKSQLFVLVSLLITSAFFVSLFGVAQKLFGLNIDTEAWIDINMFESSQQRIYSTLDNPNVLGEYLIFAIPLAFGALYYMKTTLNKIITSVMLAVMAACMVFTLSRGAWLGLIAAMAVFAMLRDKRFVWLGIIGAVLFIPFIPPAILERFSSIGDTADSSTAYRISIWQSSVKMLLDFWPIGVGLGTNVFMLIFQRYAYSAAYAQHSHNLFLQILLDTGIIGFTLFVSFVFLFFKNILVTLPKSRSNFMKTFSISIVAGMSGYLVQSMTDNTWYNNRIAMYFWLIMALSSVCKSIFISDNIRRRRLR